jgi:hypothetical protein
LTVNGFVTPDGAFENVKIQDPYVTVDVRVWPATTNVAAVELENVKATV